MVVACANQFGNMVRESQTGVHDHAKIPDVTRRLDFNPEIFIRPDSSALTRCLDPSQITSVLEEFNRRRLLYIHSRISSTLFKM